MPSRPAVSPANHLKASFTLASDLPFVPQAAAAWSEAERLQAQQTLASKRAALSQYQIAYEAWLAAGCQSQAAAALQRMGEIQNAQSDALSALDLFRRARALNAGLISAMPESGIYNGLSEAYRLLGDNEQARVAAETALRLSRNQSLAHEQARALSNLAEWAYAVGERAQAFDYYACAQEEFQRMGAERDVAMMWLCQGHIFNDTGSPVKAQAYFERAQQVWEKQHDLLGRGLALIARGHLQAKLGNGQKALAFYGQAQPLIAQVGDRVWEASLWLGSGYVYITLHNYERAEASFEQALRITREIHDATNEAASLLNLSQISLERKRPQAARDYLSQVEALAQRSGDRKLKTSVIRQIGSYYAAQGNWSLAQRYYQQAYKLHHQHKESLGMVLVLNLMGEAYSQKRLWPQAAAAFDEALQLEAATQNRQDEVKTRYGLAVLERSRGQFAAAIRQIEKALELAEHLRLQVASQNLRTTYFANAQDYYALYLELLLKQGKTAEAFEVSERARARGLNELLAQAGTDIRAGVDPQLLASERQLSEQFHQQAQRLQALPDAPERVAERAEVEREFNRLKTQLDDWESRLRASSPDYASLSRTHPARLAEVQSFLPADTLLLEYALGKNQSHLWAVSAQELRYFPLARQSDIEAEVSRLATLLKQKDRASWRAYLAVATRLRKLLLPAELAAQLPRRLLIVPSGSLNFLSFAALPLAESRVSSKTSWLIEQHEISYLPSASTLLILRNQLRQRASAPKQVAVLADGVYSMMDQRLFAARPSAALPPDALAAARPATKSGPARDGYARLYYAKEEADFIERLERAKPNRVWRAFDANLAAAQSPELADYRIVHFAAHGEISRDHPELSSVILSLFDQQGNPQPGRLMLSDIYNLRLRADLIVLSACDTALGKDWRGEGVEGLVRAFMHAGAARVMASLWKVDDEATAELMKQFYQNHFEACQPISSALRAAQLKMIADPQWSHPAYWAGFTLQGEWQ